MLPLFQPSKKDVSVIVAGLGGSKKRDPKEDGPETKEPKTTDTKVAAKAAMQEFVTAFRREDTARMADALTAFMDVYSTGMDDSEGEENEEWD